MPLVHVEIPLIPEPVAEGVKQLQTRLGLRVEFPRQVQQEAETLAAAPPAFPDHADRTDVDFLAIDPAGSRDIDQIMNITRTDGGYRVRYAIADVASFVSPGSPIDQEAHERGQTFYAPGARLPLHPPELSEGAASMLDDGQPRASYLWTIDLDADGHIAGIELEKAMVVNGRQLTYEQAQAAIDDGDDGTLGLLREVGELRTQIEKERGGISLNLPDQEINVRGGHWELEFRELLPVENWNAQISLLTGIAAATTMLEGKVGVIRTLPPAEDWAVGRLRRQARSLGVEWPRSMSYPEFVRSLEAADPKQLAVLIKCTFLFRGASYLAFHQEVPDENLQHSALATPYAHTTAPLRRLVDRYVLETCWSLLNGVEVPTWVTEALMRLPEEMNESGRKASGYERGIINLAEALVMEEFIGEVFEAALIDVHPRLKQGTYQIAEPAVEVRIPDADPEALGEMFRVRVESVDLVEGNVELSVVSQVE